MIDAPSERGRHGGLRAIDAETLGDALVVLGRGFPDRDRAFWERGFARLGPGHDAAPLGYLLGSGGENVGVLLTFRSERVRPDGGTRLVVNLAGWYVDPDHRWKAPMMLRHVVAGEGVVFTDLTPSHAVERINPALGFAPWNEGQVITFLPPWGALRARAAVEVTAFEDARAALTRPGDYDLLERHAAMGCIAAVLREPGGASPLLFRVRRRKGFRVAQLVYAESRLTVLAHRTAIARFLVARGILVLSVDADRADCPRGSFFRQGRRRFLKGPLDRDRLDYAFSELVLLDLDD